MKIGIIGAGTIGSALAIEFVKAGHSVTISNSRGPHTLKKEEELTGAKAATSNEAVQDADVIVVTIPLKNIPLLGKDLLKNVPEHVAIIDTNNYYESRDGYIEELTNQSITESEWVAKHIGRSVIKVFNNISAFALNFKGAPENSLNRIALPVSGDNLKEKQVVFQLLNQIGFDHVDTGSISESWRQQPGTPCYGSDWNKEELKKSLELADRSISASNLKKQLGLVFANYQEYVKTHNKDPKTFSFTNYVIEGGREVNDKLVSICRTVFAGNKTL